MGSLDCIEVDHPMDQTISPNETLDNILYNASIAFDASTSSCKYFVLRAAVAAMTKLETAWSPGLESLQPILLDL